MLADLKARGVKAVDLRPALTEGRKHGEMYLMNDAHWTARGAITGFNAVVEADGHPDWRVDPETSLGPPQQRRGGDIARILGIQDETTETIRPLSLPSPASDEPLVKGPMPDHIVSDGKPGPTILIIGDSFTASYFPIMLAPHVGRAIWIHHHECGFDWSAIDRFHPDEVWWAPTERFLICDPHVRPLNFPGLRFARRAPERARRRGLLSGARRYLALAVFVLVAAPMVVGFIHPDSAAEVLHEGRWLAPWPDLPQDGADWLKLPGRLDAYLRDHFGMRSAMIRAHKDLTKPMLGAGDGDVLVGRDGRMFYLGEEAVRQSAGLIMRDERIAATVSLLAAMNAELEKRHIRFVVAAPPNSSTVYQDDLPYWAQNNGRRTEYDAYLQGLRAHGVRVVDLRPAMTEARKDGAAYYRHDTHWAPRGALAAYDAIIAADGHPDWRVDPKDALTPPETKKGGDLARLLGQQDGVSETNRKLQGAAALERASDRQPLWRLR